MRSNKRWDAKGGSVLRSLYCTQGGQCGIWAGENKRYVKLNADEKASENIAEDGVECSAGRGGGGASEVMNVTGSNASHLGMREKPRREGMRPTRSGRGAERASKTQSRKYKIVGVPVWAG